MQSLQIPTTCQCLHAVDVVVVRRVPVITHVPDGTARFGPSPAWLRSPASDIGATASPVGGKVGRSPEPDIHCPPVVLPSNWREVDGKVEHFTATFDETA